MSTACALSTLKEGGVLAFFGGGLFRPVCRPHVHFSTPKRGEVLAIFVLGSFSGRLSTACALSTPKRGWDKLVLLGCLICLGPQIVPKTGQDHRHFLGRGAF